MNHNLILFLGRFHPLLVHLPIGGLVALAFLELVALSTRCQQAAQASRWMLGFVAGTAAVSAAAGWMLAHDGGYELQLLNWHRALGFALAGGCLLTFLLRLWGRLWAYRLSLIASLVMLVVVSHLGGSITHGRGFLTRYAPAFFGGRSTWVAQRAPAQATCPPMQQPVFASVIGPLLEQRCAACHGAERHKGQLRLDSLEGWLRGGQDGPVIKLGHAPDSPLIQRLLLPLEADGHMPPEDQPQLSSQEIALLVWRINAGAPAAATVGDLGPKPEIRRFLEVVSAPPTLRD